MPMTLYQLAPPRADWLQHAVQRATYRHPFNQQLLRLCATQVLRLLYGQFVLRVWQQRRTLTRVDAARLGCSLGLSSALGKLLSWVIECPRPYEVSGLAPLLSVPAGESFPSTHAVQATTLALQLARVSPWPVRAPWIGALLVLLGRLGTNVHYTRDVLAGVGLGAASCWLVWRLPFPPRWEQPVWPMQPLLASALKAGGRVRLIQVLSPPIG